MTICKGAIGGRDSACDIRRWGIAGLVALALVPATSWAQQDEDLGQMLQALQKQQDQLRQQQEALQTQITALQQRLGTRVAGNDVPNTTEEGNPADPPVIARETVEAPKKARTKVAQTVQVGRFGSVRQVTRDLDDEFQIYGVFRLSLDYADSDVKKSQVQEGRGITDGNFSLSSNTTIFGFRGAYGFDVNGTGYTAVWQLEQYFDPDIDRGSEVFATSNTFAGVRTPAGTFLAGRMNTPFKSIGIEYSEFNTTIADPHNIFGASASSPARLDLRSDNALMWLDRFGNLDVAVQYGLDQNKGVYRNVNGEVSRGTLGLIDDNSFDMYSASASWHLKPFNLGAGYVDYSHLYAGGNVSGYRLGANYDVGTVKIGGLYENLNADKFPSLDRQAYGGFANYFVTPRNRVSVQWLHANASEQGDDSGDQFSFGGLHFFTEKLLAYAVFTQAWNDDNASYRIADYAHGDRVNTVSGGDPWGVSIGGQLEW